MHEKRIEGHSATDENVAPERRGLGDVDVLDTFAGTTSGVRLRGKPNKGSRNDLGA